MRPVYETSMDKQREREIVEGFAAHFGRVAQKQPDLCVVDYMLTKPDGTTTAVIEAKDRKYSMEQMDRMGGFLISKRKIDEGVSLARDKRLSYVLTIRADGVTWFMCITPDEDFPAFRSGRGGRRDRGDPKDIEDCYFIEASRFRRLDQSRAA